MIAATAEPDAGPAPALRAARSQLDLVALVFAIAAIEWWSTGARMSGMDEGPWTGLGALGWFLGAWVVMMTAPGPSRLTRHTGPRSRVSVVRPRRTRDDHG